MSSNGEIIFRKSVELSKISRKCVVFEHGVFAGLFVGHLMTCIAWEH